MGKYSEPYRRAPIPPRSRTIHPIWRGIGCLLFILIPVLAFAGARVLVQENARQNWLAIPAELRNSFNMPVIGQVFYADLMAALALMVVGYGLLIVLYAILYRLFGPPAHGPLDSP